ncbi:uncharacterized protein [Gossypium hirsutum]|uniref:Reverse transcriptase/retrotransposon-derived protein RNase H-like domain-containing protein n=1 Tax=Gossypium hirsutum TaxID=3635 RepID=A0A1U8IB20_GOSHI|nr:uncharacterized protein LOC107894560 [Gossypium hirsutum]
MDWLVKHRVTLDCAAKRMVLKTAEGEEIMMIGYYRRFLEGFFVLAAPLTKLIRKGAPFVWTEKQQEAFERLKEVLTEAPVLIQSEPGKDFTVYSNASHKLAKLYVAEIVRLHGVLVLGPELVANIEDKVRIIKDRLKEAPDRQKLYANLKRK